MEACVPLGEREQARTVMDQVNTIVMTRCAAVQDAAPATIAMFPLCFGIGLKSNTLGFGGVGRPG